MYPIIETMAIVYIIPEQIQEFHFNKKANTQKTIVQWSLEMSLSWNFPARASPSCEGSEPSQAEFGHFDFWAETELKIF